MVTRKAFAVLTGWLLCAAVLCGVPVRAADIEGVRVEDRITLPGGPALVLNGAGVRTKLGFVKLYVGALHLSAKNKSAEEILKDTGAKRVSMLYCFLKNNICMRLQGIKPIGFYG